jgi:DNA-directed RNA polymerase subunit alpha
MKEEVAEFLLNVKGIRIRSVTGRVGKMRLEVAGEGRVCAGDIAATPDLEIVNPELHLATLDSPDARLSVEFTVEQGKGYRPATQGDGLPEGVLPVDAIFSPVKKVNYTVEQTRVGQVTDYERLVLELWTDGTTTPLDAVQRAAQILVDHFYLFSTVGKALEARERPAARRVIPPEVYQIPIERLELSQRTLNCLKRARITRVGQILEMSDEELLRIRNFGEKSLEELKEKLRAQGLLEEEEEPQPEREEEGQA